MTNCSICNKQAVKTWVNPSNPEDSASYCQEHYNAISKGYGNLEELIALQKIKGKVCRCCGAENPLKQFFCKKCGWRFPETYG